MAEVRAATRVFAVPELLENILLETPMKDVLFAQRVSREFRNNVKGSIALQRRLFLLPCEKTPEEILYGDEKQIKHLDYDRQPTGSFVYNPMWDTGYSPLVAAPTAASSTSDTSVGDTFAEELHLDSHGVIGGSDDDQDRIYATCWCERVHYIPVIDDEKDLAFPGSPDVFAPSDPSHSWRQMVYSQPATRAIEVILYCRDETVVYESEFKAGTRMGEIVDWMEEQYREHQKTGARLSP